MPLYEYECQQCGDRSEVVQRFSDDPLTTCKKCGGQLTKLISAPAFQFKGSGWYVTDYAKKGGGDKSGDSGSSGDSSSAGSSSDSGSSDKTASSSSKTDSKSSSSSSSSSSTSSSSS